MRADFLDELLESDEGHFLVDSVEGRAILTVHPPGKKGKAVRLPDVLARLNLFGVTEFNKVDLESIVHDADAQGHDIGIFPPPESRDAKVTIQISDDRMDAWALVDEAANGGAWISEEQLDRALQDAGVTHGIVEGWKKNLLSGPPNFSDSSDSHSHKTQIRYPIAQGTRPIPGRPAVLEYRFHSHAVSTPGKGLGSVDFRKLGAIQSCNDGDLLAELTSAVSGKPGITVTGQDPGMPQYPEPKLLPGKNTRLSEDGSKIFATRSGQVRSQEQFGNTVRFDVEDVLQLENVNFATGHVDFPGTVVVAGTVADGFYVNAGGDILVEKSVGNVNLTSGGNIILAGGIAARGHAVLRAKGQIVSRFAQAAILHAGDSVILEQGALNSRITSGKDILMESGKGELIGGDAICSGTLRARKIGSRAGTPTRIRLGLDPETLESLGQLDTQIAEKNLAIAKIKGHLKITEEKRHQDPMKIDPAAAEITRKLLIVETKYETMVSAMEKQRRRLQEKIHPNPDSKLSADELFPGVEIFFGVGVPPFRPSGKVEKSVTLSLHDGRIAFRS